MAVKTIYNHLSNTENANINYYSFDQMCELIKDYMNNFNANFDVDDTFEEMIDNGLIEVHPRFNEFCDDCDDIVNSFEDVNRLIEQFWSKL